MLSSTATRCGHPPDVHPTSTSKPIPQTLLPLPPTGFLACPSQHGLGRTGLKSSSDEMLLQAIMSSISYRLEKLSLSDEPALESPNPPVNSPVYAATPAGTDSTPSKNPVRPRLVHAKAKLFERLSNGLKAGLYRSIKKRGHTKKAQAPISALPPSQCERQYSLGQRVQATGGLPVFDTWEANSHTQDTKFQEPLAFVVQGAPAQHGTNSTFLQPWSSDTSPSTSTSTVWTLGDEVTDDAMDEDEQRSPSPRSRSPTPMDLEASPPSGDATRVPESPQAPVGVSVGGDTIRDPVPEPADENMSDEEQGSSNSEGPHQPESTDMMMIDSSSTPSVSPTVFNREIDMVDAEDSNRSTSFTSPTTSSAQLARDAPASNERIQLATIDTNPRPVPDSVRPADVAASQEQSSPAQPLPASSFHQVEEVSSAASEPNAPNRPVENIQSTDPAPVPTANATLTPAAVDQVVAPPASATESTAGPSTPTPSSSSRNSSQVPGQATIGHASRVHQVLGKLRLSKQAPKSTQPSVNDEASEEAEATAFFDNLLKRAPRRDLSKPQAKPAPPPPTSEPKRTNGSACRSLMDDIMAGFKKSSNPTSSPQQQITASRSTAQTPPTTQPAHQRSIPPVEQPDPQPPLPSSVVETRRFVVASPSGRAPATVSATGKVLSSSPTTLSTQQSSLPVVAGRQPGPNFPPSSSLVRTGRQVAAQPSGRAPWTVSATDKMNGPPGSVSARAGIPSESHQPSSAGMDGIESGRRPVKGSGRVARAIRKTGLTWQLVQQNVQRNQAALGTAQVDSAASTAMSALDRDEEERRSQEWHAAQPPPPPEAIPYITTGEEYEGDENDHEALLDWILGQED